VAAQSVNQCHFGDAPKDELTEYVGSTPCN
jgi:hypothetical protein